MADFGGAIGLWVGASMITVFEFGEYFLDLLILCCARRSNDKTRSRSRVKVSASDNGDHGNKNIPPASTYKEEKNYLGGEKPLGSRFS